MSKTVNENGYNSQNCVLISIIIKKRIYIKNKKIKGIQNMNTSNRLKTRTHKNDAITQRWDVQVRAVSNEYNQN